MQDETPFGPQAYLPGSAVLERLPEAEKVPVSGGVASLYRLPGAQGHLGLISPLSTPFCAACDRIRLTADGKLKPCLHVGEELGIKGLDAAGMEEQFRRAILAKPACHPDLSAERFSQAGRTMNQIGG